MHAIRGTSRVWKWALGLPIAGVLLIALVMPAYCAPVTDIEAARVADQWLASDINAGASAETQAERAEKLAGLRDRDVLYLLSADELVDRPIPGRNALAYVVKYRRGGYVVVSADDRLSPVMAFDQDAEFRWDKVSQNFMRSFLGETMPAMFAKIKSDEAGGVAMGTDPQWTRVRARANAIATLDEAAFDRPPTSAGTILLRWKTALYDQGTWYNDVIIEHCGDVPGIVTGCNATANAMKYRFHEWPVTGYGTHSYCDTSGAVQACHSVNYGTHTYNWSQMPVTSLTGPNLEVATLMYHTGVSCGSNFEVGATGAMTNADEINTHFRYKGTTWINGWNGHLAPLLACLRAGLPTLTCNPSHIFITCGYRDDTTTPYYYMNLGWNGGSNGWYTIDNYPSGTGEGFNGSWPYSLPNCYMYVDGAFTGTSNGNLQNPYKTIAGGEAAVPSGGRLWIKGGAYSSSLALDSPMTITAFQGDVSMAGSLLLKNKEADNITYANLPAIKISTGGAIKTY